MKIIVTGGAGFIGSAVARYIVENTLDEVLIIDKLTYAGNLESLDNVWTNERFSFKQIDICNRQALDDIIVSYSPDIIMHLAAESHVDRSIDNPSSFIETNIIGTYTLLESSLNYWRKLDQVRQSTFRFHHISTDEVYGDLHGTTDLFTEKTPYSPSSPYSASKASSDHLVRAWHRTFGLPTVITNCSNNYGPYHFPEKLIPLMILNALEGKPLPVYGNGQQIRDWLYVEDLICDLLEELVPNKPNGVINYKDLICFVTDRPGHDQRYAIDASKIYHDLGWKPQETFESGMRKTVEWYLKNSDWCNHIKDGSYARSRQGILKK